MPSITSWTRLEPRARSDAMQDSLQARVHDPLWLLARQWQFGEFQGEDNGSLVQLFLEAERSSLTRYLPGQLKGAGTGASRAYDSRFLPLEPQVEREVVHTEVGNRRLAAEAGLHFFRLLGLDLAKKYRSLYLKVNGYAMQRPSGADRQTLDTHSLRFLDIMAGRALDGARLYADLKAAGPGALPTTPVIEPDDRLSVLKVAQAWLAWYETLFSEPAETDTTWIQRQLEYEFAVAAPTTVTPATPNGEAVLRAPEYAGGHLDWHAFTVAPDASLGAAENQARSLEGREGTVALAIAPEGERALLAGKDGTFTFLSLDSGTAMESFDGPEGALAVAFTPLGARALIARADGSLMLWDIENAREEWGPAGRGSPVRAAALAGEGRRALVGDADGTLTLWDTEGAQVVGALTTLEGIVTAASLSPDGTRALAAFENGTLAFWNLDQSDEPQVLDHLRGPVTAVALAAEGEQALAALASGTLTLWTLDESEEPRAFWGHTTPVEALAFSADRATALSAGSDGALKQWELKAIAQSAVESISRVAIPTPLYFRGMPAARWWEFEDAQVNFGAVEAAPEDLARLLLMEYTLIYGNDFFIIPVELPVGSLCRIYSLIVTNTFGERISIPAASAAASPAGGKPWRMFTLSPDSGLSASGSGADFFFLPPVLGSSLESTPVEDVRFVRDEMANMAWAIERVVQSEAGWPLDRLEHLREEARRVEMADPDSTIRRDGPIAYRLATEVPSYWFPLLPKPLSAGAIELQLGGLYQPKGRILQQTLSVNEEEVPRTGVRITRSYQYARWIDGSTHLWIGRRKRPGRGEASSGLQFDVIEPQATESNA